jgi:hypothetical protein
MKMPPVGTPSVEDWLGALGEVDRAGNAIAHFGEEDRGGLHPEERRRGIHGIEHELV